MENKDKIDNKTNGPFGDMKPNDFNLNEDSIFMTLYNVWNRAKRAETVQREILETEKKRLQVELKNQEILNSILKEELAGADAGEYLKISGTVTISEFVISDTDIAPGHPAKGYVIINDGPNTIYVGHNMALSSIGPEIIDVTSPIARFNRILDGESLRFEFNRRKVKNIYILSTVGDSTYRGWLVW